jgi:hypothetical protein
VKNYSLLKAQGTLELKLLDQFGNVIETCQHTNLVVNTGLVYIASRIKDTSNDVMSHMAIGTNNAATAATQSTLLAEVARVALGSTTIATTTVANDTVQYIATFDANIGTGPITEAATFNAASGGTMLCRTKFDVINKGPNDTLVITWKISLAAV